MPINPNIALGVRPTEQPNMLAQMGQMMQLRQMQQGFESENALRDFYAQGGDLSSAEGKRQLMSKVGLKGMDIIGKQSEISARDIGTAEKSLAMLKNQAGLVKTPQDAARWLSSFYDNPLTRPYVEAVAPRDQALAAIPNDPAGFETWLKRSSLKADQIFTSADAELRAKVDREGHGVQMRGQNMTDARLREQLEFDRNKRNVIAGDNQFLQTDAYGNVYPVAQFGATRGPNAAPAAAPVAGGGGGAPALPSTAANAFVTARPSVNAFAPTAAPQGAGPTVAAAAALDQQANIPRPKQPVRQPVAVIKDGVVTLVPPEEAVGMTPATPGAEKALEKTATAAEGKESVNRVLGTLYSEYSNLVKSGGITDTRRSMEENIAARTGASGVGQLTGSFTGSEAQSFRDTIEQTRPLLLTAIMKATGLSATQLNSNVELQTYLKTATDPKVSIQSNVKALNNISTMFGIGEKFEVPEIKTSKSANLADAPPPGLSPEIAKLWQYMPAEDRKLWQK